MKVSHVGFDKSLNSETAESTVGAIILRAKPKKPVLRSRYKKDPMPAGLDAQEQFDWRHEQNDLKTEFETTLQTLFAQGIHDLDNPAIQTALQRQLGSIHDYEKSQREDIDMNMPTSEIVRLTQAISEEGDRRRSQLLQRFGIPPSASR